MKALPPQRLGPQHKMVIYMSAIGKTTAQIAEEMEMSKQYVQFLRRELREEIEKEVEDVKLAIIAKRAGITHRFDKEADSSFDRLVEIRNGSGKEDATALKATLALLDRSSVAPILSKQEKGGETKILQLPIVQVMNVIKAAAEDGLESEAAEVLEAFTEDGR